MEKFTVLIPTATAEMLHLLARESEQNIGDILHEMALERYMRHALGAADMSGSDPEMDVLPAAEQVS